MKYFTRRYGSQRRSKETQVKFEINFGGQGGQPYMVFVEETAKGLKYHFLQPENIADVKELQSQAAILALNLLEGEKKNG